MNTDKKAVFFDADGTICDIEKGSSGQCGRGNPKIEWKTDMRRGCAPEEAGLLSRAIWNRFRLPV